jgi:hypothetical protein
MKTERRHELQTNVLASSLAHWLKAAQPYSRAGLAIVIALVVALFAWAYLSTQNTRRVADGWNEYFEAVSGSNPDPRAELRDISSRYSDMLIGQWARLTLGNIELDVGTNQLLSDRKAARDQLRESREKFKALLLEATHRTIRERATYGLALTHEGLGELDEARAQYRELAKQWPDGPFAAVAEARARELDELPTKNFYDWLARYEPPSATGPGTPGARPDFLQEPDAGGMLDLPSSATPVLPSITDEPLGDKPATDTPTEPAETSPAPAESDKTPETPAEPPSEPSAEPSADKPTTSESGPELK